MNKFILFYIFYLLDEKPKEFIKITRRNDERL